ncbi:MULTISPECIES: hydroxyquinol 1,2-dioxygenase [unclassified Cupriavidus]|uniref:hydroxyquinol 1,2-dioxygenase n=1 Tax=unclassified Cupriavidus TaxID=2640874 RepID=UPI001AE65561|nr:MULTISPECIES: hydroxyquinol 1,2-dioxygenase [unclassified Cupriavidus]MBP0629676.1 hydroxyquinol 1,2-dioxygenase [Cupriavidus sp. AcVe19-1a]MBP0636702.1 hydroxyquinol 1,2-dioxygenase [Cupriavidus sp. AcVe19-6a]
MSTATHQTAQTAQTAHQTVFGSLARYRKGSIEVTQGSARHYVFSNIFEVAAHAAPFDKVVVGKNLEYVIETLRAEGVSPWYACAHDEFAVLMDGEVRVDLISLNEAPASGKGTVLAGAEPAGKPMGHIVLRQGHQCLLPAGCAYRFTALKPGVLLVQTILGALSIEKWSEICIK